MTLTQADVDQAHARSWRARAAAQGWVLVIDRDGLLWARPGWLRTRHHDPAVLVPRRNPPAPVLLGAVDPEDPYAYLSANRIACALGWRLAGRWTTAGRTPVCTAWAPGTDSPGTVPGRNTLKGEAT